MSDVTAFLGGAFRPGEHEASQDFEVLPPGDYPVVIETASIKQTKAGNGHYVEVTLQVLDGPAKGRKIWDRMNIDNPSQQAVGIAKRQLAALGQSIGIPEIVDTDQLIGKLTYAVIKVKGNNNEVRTYVNAQQAAERAAKSGASQVQQAAAVPPQAPVQAPAPVQPQAPVAPATVDAGPATVAVVQPPVATPVAAPAPAAPQQEYPPGYVPDVAGVGPASPQTQVAGKVPWER
jgi:hypothetical protein